MIELTAIRDLVAIFGVIAGFSYYVLTVRNAQRNQTFTLKSQEESLETRQTALMMQIFHELGSPEYWERYTRYRYGQDFESFDEFWEKSGPVTNPEGYAEISSFWYAYVAIGSLVYRNKLDLDYVGLFLGDLPVRAWEKWRHIILELRANYGWEGAYISWEYLAHRIKEHLKSDFNERVISDMRRKIDSIPL
jgi:hypothetical protein